MFKLVVLSSVLAMAAAAPSGLGLGALGLGLGWGGLGHLGAPLAAPLAAPVLAGAWGAPWAAAAPWAAVGHGGVAAAPAIAAYNYRGPLSLAPGQPANILAQDGRPLDTINVNLDRAAHLTAKALDPAGAHGHLIGKRSAPLLGAAWSHTARIDLPGRLIAPGPLAIPAAPLGIHGGLGLGHAGLGLGHAGLGLGPVGPLGLGGLGGWGHAGHLGLGW